MVDRVNSYKFRELAYYSNGKSACLGGCDRLPEL